MSPILKTLSILFLLTSFAASGETRALYPGERPLPTEDSEHLPGESHPDYSKIEQTVHEADSVVVGEGEEITYQDSQARLGTDDYRKNSRHSLMLGYQFLTTWLTGKKTISYTFIVNENWSWELEHGWQTLDSSIVGVDLGRISEKRTSLLGRRYVGDSFHFIMGAMYQDFNARASGKVLSKGVDVASFGAEGAGAVLGIGNRWQWKNGMTLGIDWLRVNVPLLSTKVENQILDEVDDNSDSNDIKKVIRTFNHIPTFVVFGLNLGYTF